MSEITDSSLTVLSSRRGRRLRADAPSVVRSVRFSPAELERLEKAAHVNRQRLSDFAREAIVTAADDCLESIS